MKQKGIFVLFLFLLVGCGTQTTSSSEPTAQPTTSQSIPLVELETEEIVEGGSNGGYFIEINTERLLAENSSYHCTFEASNPKKNIRVESTRPESITVELGSNPNRDIILKTHAAGDSIIKIYDADEMLVFRKVVRVRNAYSQEEIEDVLYDNDLYLGMKFLGDHRITFTETDPLVGIFSGSDDFEKNMRIKFETTFTSYLEDRDVYQYNLEITDRDDHSTTIIKTLQIAPTGDVMYLYYGTEESLLNIFVAEQYTKYYESGLF